MPGDNGAKVPLKALMSEEMRRTLKTTLRDTIKKVRAGKIALCKAAIIARAAQSVLDRALLELDCIRFNSEINARTEGRGRKKA